MSLGSQVFPGTTALSVLLLLMTATGTASPDCCKRVAIRMKSTGSVKPPCTLHS